MSSDSLVEDVPRLVRRAGDAVLASQNNSALICGRDRRGSVDSGHGDGPGAGAASLVVGRRGTDPSVPDDAATLYLSAKGDPDADADTDGFGETSTAVPSAVLRADCVRISSRKDLKLAAGSSHLTLDGSATLEGSSVNLGEGAGEPAVLGRTYRAAEDALINSLITALNTYAGSIAGVADISGAATAALAAALAAALSSFQGPASTYLSRKVLLV